ncbi:MAG: hypothetical protein ACXWAB_04010 [Methylobacter sp.]
MFKIMFGVAFGIVLAGIINTGKQPWLVETVIKWIENSSHQAQQVMGNNSINKIPKNRDGIIREESAKADSLIRKEPEGFER